MAIRSDFWMTGFAKLHFPITIGGMQKVGFGIIGGGLMGREFASAVARWGHLLKMPAKPSVEMVSGLTLEELSWFSESMPMPPKLTTNWRDILANPDVDVVYASLPHNMHEEVFTAVLKAGKHLMGEKPFGIDQKAFNTIAEESRRRPKQLVRVASQMHFFPAAQKIGQMIESGEIGQVIEVRTGFLHSSDLDPLKPINWKRQAAINGAYGAMGDLGMHACSMPIRAGWKPLNVRAILRKVVKERPDRNGKMQPCDTPDNATLFCEMQDPATGEHFPWTLRTHRIAPGEQNSWYIEVLGTKTSARFSTVNCKRLEILRYNGGSDQAWCAIEMGSHTTYPIITAAAFEVGFCDVIQQMWAAFITELVTGKVPHAFARCVTLEDVGMSHRLFTAALKSQEHGTVEAV